MYARWVVLMLKPGADVTIGSLVTQFTPLYRAQPGFASVTFVGDEATGECGSLSVWASREAAEAAGAALLPQLQQVVAGLLIGPPTSRFYAVYEAGPAHD